MLSSLAIQTGTNKADASKRRISDLVYVSSCVRGNKLLNFSAVFLHYQIRALEFSEPVKNT